MSTVSTPPRSYHPLSVTTLDFWAGTAEQREETFRVLRDEAPLSWHPPMEGALMPSENDGVWVVTRHEDITAVSKAPDVFCSGQGVMFEDVPADILEAASSFLAMDAPRHGMLRRLVSSAFTPKQVAKLHDQIAAQARSIVDELLVAGGGDFVELVSHRLPMWTIYQMMGLEPALQEEAAHLADGMVSWNDADVARGRESGEVLNDSLVGLLTMGIELAEHRRRHPASDLMTNLIDAEVDGERLTDDEIASFFVLLSVAGNDTTRNTITLTAKALQDHPAQRELLRADFDSRIKTAVDEFIRWASPVMTFRRTATRDTVLAGQEIRAGDWVALMYSSGNRDERVFADPRRFDVTRSPNPHVGFGGGGPHFCMGNFIARMQLTEMIGQLLTRAPGLEVGEPEYLVGNFVHAVKRMSCAVR
jgi:cytochrome P450